MVLLAPHHTAEEQAGIAFGKKAMLLHAEASMVSSLTFEWETCSSENKITFTIFPGNGKHWACEYVSGMWMDVQGGRASQP